MSHEKPDSKEYRDELAGKLKEIRNSDPEKVEESHAKAEGYLDAKKETGEYQEARKETLEDRDEKMDREAVAEHGLEWINEFVDDPEALKQNQERNKFLLESGLGLDIGSSDEHYSFEDIDHRGNNFRYHIDTDNYNVKELRESIDSHFVKVPRFEIDLDGLVKKYPRAERFTKNITGYNKYHSSLNGYRNGREDITAYVNNPLLSMIRFGFVLEGSVWDWLPEDRFTKFAKPFVKTEEQLTKERNDKKREKLEAEIEAKRKELEGL